MKRILILTLALSVMFTVASFAQDARKTLEWPKLRRLL